MEIFNIIGNISSILGLIVAIFLTTQVVSIKNKINDNSSTRTTQRDNKVGGDVAGRDINK